MADRKYGHPPPGTEIEVRDQDWDGRDLSGETHTRVAFAELDMTEAANVGAVFDMCTFRDVLLNASTHTDAAFILKVSGGEWSFVGLSGADLRSATFENVRMREADLTGARLDGATVRGVDQAVTLAVALGLDVRPE